MLKALLSSLLCVFVNYTFAQTSESDVKYFAFEDTTARLPFARVSSSSFENFQLTQGNVVWHETTKSAIWVRFQLTDTARVERFMELTCPNFAEVIFYQPYSGGGYKEFRAGMLSNFNSRPIPIDRFAFPLTNGAEWHYIKIRTDHFINTELHVKTLEEIIEDASARNLLYTAYMGLMLAVVAGVIFYTWLIRYYSYLFYVGYILFLSSVSLMERGFYFQLFWPNHPEVNAFFPILPFGISVCMLLFLRKIWINTKIATILYRISLWVLTILPFPISLIFSLKHQYAEAVTITQAHSFIIIIFVIAMSVISLVKAEKSLKLPLMLINAGFCVLCISGLIFISTINHRLPSNFFTDNAMIFGSMLEVAFLTAALVIRSDEIYKMQKLILLQKRKY